MRGSVRYIQSVLQREQNLHPKLIPVAKKKATYTMRCYIYPLSSGLKQLNVFAGAAQTMSVRSRFDFFVLKELVCQCQTTD